MIFAVFGCGANFRSELRRTIDGDSRTICDQELL